MKREDTIAKIRELKLRYVENAIGNDPAQLPAYVAEFNGYAAIFYEQYADYIQMYEEREAKVVQDENAARTEYNRDKVKRDDRMSVAEVEQRIDVRLGDLKAEKKRLEILAKGTTQHLNVCQSLMKNWGDEAKGVR